MTALTEIAISLAVFFLAVGLLGYAVALVLAAFYSKGPESNGGKLAAWFTAYPAQNLGVPCAAISSFAIVAILMRAFATSSDAASELTFKAFGLEFAGPSGPITLWLMCFLGFVFALRLLRS
ncbi:MAG TPA: hypothetical protein VMJ31_03055 [Methylocystis sp.]|nr:hypothetical protein [Methylocystis sp.]